MARIRTIKPDFWEDEKIGKLPIPCRLFFIGCWNFADDFGCIKGSASLLKSQIFPYDENLRASEVKKWIDALVDARMLIPIIHAEESYYYIRTFRSHQVLDSRYSKSYIGKEIVNDLINKALNANSENTSSTHSVHNVMTSEEKEEEMEKEMETNPPLPPKGESDKIDFNSFMNYFNETFKGKLSAVTKMTDKRKKAVKARIAEHGKESVRTVYKNILSSSFLLGESGGSWTCDFDFIFSPSKYIKILEGNYNGKSNNAIQSGPVRFNSNTGTAKDKAASRNALGELARTVLGKPTGERNE